MSDLLIYKVINKVNNKVYVGQTTRSLEERKIQHLSNADRGCNFIFHRAIRKHGEDNFDWVVLEKCSNIDKLNKREEQWIKKLNTISPNGYNLRSGGENSSVHIGTKNKMSKAHIGKKFSKDHRKNLSLSLRGKKKSDETKRKISEAKKGKTRSEEVKRKLSESREGEKNHFWGKTHSEETKMKISKANTGKKHSEESKTRMFEAMRGKNNPFYGKKHTEESLKKMSESKTGMFKGCKNSMYGKTGSESPMYGRTGVKHPMYGKNHSEETKKRISKALTKRWACKKSMRGE